MDNQLFILTVTIALPIMMIFFGAYSAQRPPKKINRFYGYRTAMSMKNMETWTFAHRHSGQIWLFMGSVMFVVSIAAMMSAFLRDENFARFVGLICMFQCAVLIVSIIPTEIALRKNFDKNGKRKN